MFSLIRERKLGDRRRFKAPGRAPMPRGRGHSLGIWSSKVSSECLASLRGREGDTVKLREHPKARTTKPTPKGAGGRGNDLGYGNNVRDATVDNLQPSATARRATRAVHRLDVGGGPMRPLRYSRSPGRKPGTSPADTVVVLTINYAD
jgi:hypothetical protein